MVVDQCKSVTVKAMYPHKALCCVQVSGTSGELQNNLGYQVFTQAHAQISILRGLKVRGQVTTVDEIRAPPSSSARSGACAA